MIGKMPGNRQEQFENLKASYGFMMCHPGKKLLFMGQDIGEYDEWNEDRSVEWELLENADHKGLSEFVKALNHLYCKQPALYKKDTSWDGFEWINCINANDCILSFVRKADKPEEMLLIVLNFANVERKNFQVGVPFNGKYKEILNSDAKAFGGEGRVNPRVKTALEEPFDGREYSIKITQAPLGISIFSYQPYTKEELKEIAKKKAEKEKKAREAARKKKGAKKAAAKTLKEELAEKVFEVDEVIAEKGEVEKPVKVVKSRRKADGQ
ncbi:MAG: alpha amylase C-terminal domain-containing protein [Eisenbergiella massiliensis]